MEKIKCTKNNKAVRSKATLLFAEVDNEIVLTSISDHSYFGLDIVSKSNGYSS